LASRARKRDESMVKRDPINPEAVYSREEVAELLGVSLSTVKRLIAARQVEVSRPESIRRIFIKGSSILSMLEETKIEAVR
ncbi:MAG: helix-turn-helix domain-containing protein, partial [Roseiflexaceae bacterium]